MNNHPESMTSLTEQMEESFFNVRFLLNIKL